MGRTGTFIGLSQSSVAPGFRTNVGFLSGPAGAVADLTLRDRSGATVATRSGAAVLGAYAFYQPPLSDLFPGTSIPEDVTLDVTPTDGTVDVYASFIDNGTGDPVIYPFAVPEVALPGNVAATSPCAASPGVAGLINAGTTLSRVDLDTTRYPEAVCNDGTPGLFYVRKGTGAGANRWIIFLEGGGACFEGTECARRWCSVDTAFGAAKMSNRYAPARGVGGGGILATRADSAFTDFNKAGVYYCSSDVWSGRSGSSSGCGRAPGASARRCSGPSRSCRSAAPSCCTGRRGGDRDGGGARLDDDRAGRRVGARRLRDHEVRHRRRPARPLG